MLPITEAGTVPAGDQIPELVRPRFAAQGAGVHEEVLGEHARSTLGETAQSLTPQAFADATQQGSVETFALVRPAEVNSNAGVYIYLDEIGVLKELKKNPRAAAIAASCGHVGVSFAGDVYVGRVCTQPVPMRNGDFFIKDLDSSNDWIKTAPEENYKYGIGMKEVEAALNSKGNSQQIKLGGFDEGEMPRGAAPDGSYSWTQTNDDVEVVVPLQPGTRAKDLSVSIKRQSLFVSTGSSTLVRVDTLNGSVGVDDSTWTVEGGRLVVTMEKSRPSIWRMLSADGKEGE